MKNNKEVQEKFTEAEKEFSEARLELRNSSEKSSQYANAFEDYSKAKQRLQDVKNEIKGTVLFLETTYFVRCGECGYTNGIYCKRPPNTLECGCCGKTSQIKYEIVKAPSY